MNYYQQVAVLAHRVLSDTNEYFNRHIRDALEDYDGSFVLGIYPDDAELLILDVHSNGFTLGEIEAEMEYMYRVLFEKDVPLYIYGHNDSVTVIDKEQAYGVYSAFCAKLFPDYKTAKLVAS